MKIKISPRETIGPSIAASIIWGLCVAFLNDRTSIMAAVLMGCILIPQFWELWADFDD